MQIATSSPGLPLLVFPVLLALGACAGARAASRVAVAPVPTTAATSAVAPQAASATPQVSSGGSVTRAAIRDVLSQGLGAFLERVDVDDHPVMVGGRFHGFRIAALRHGGSWSGFWTGVDLRPGDVVTSVNGFPIEHPEQAQTAFDSLAVASELRVAYERAGVRCELVYSIVDGSK
ncbi:MAG: serine protease [Polyangiaceae bacterium]